MRTKIPNLVVPPGYRSQAWDTSIEADLLEFYLLRQRSSQERLRMAASLMQSAHRLSLRCLRSQFASLSPEQFSRKLAEVWLQEDCPPAYIPDGSEMTWIQDSIQLATQLRAIFDAVNIPYYVTGGVAVITYGEPRTTRDLDVVFSISQSDLMGLMTAMEQAGFYIADLEDVLSGRMKTLQIIQIETIPVLI